MLLPWIEMEASRGGQVDYVLTGTTDRRWNVFDPWLLPAARRDAP
jgi:hypothetical protein